MDQNQTPSVQELLAKIAALEAAAAKPKATNSMKVSAKGAVSVYGLGRFPVTLYATQWEALIQKVDEIKAFMEANRAQLATKPE